MRLSSQVQAERLASIARSRALVHEAIRLAREPGGCVLALCPCSGDPLGALLTLDPCGGWRVTWFSADGLDPAHVCCRDKYEAALMALRAGYADTDRELLRRLQRNPRFFAKVWEH